MTGVSKMLYIPLYGKAYVSRRGIILRDMTPQCLIDELSGMEKHIFRKLYAGKISKKLYRLFKYRTG